MRHYNAVKDHHHHHHDSDEKLLHIDKKRKYFPVFPFLMAMMTVTDDTMEIESKDEICYA